MKPNEHEAALHRHAAEHPEPVTILGLSTEVVNVAHLRTALAEVDALRAQLAAAQRLATGAYPAWTSAGGPDECEHGVAGSLDCRACDLRTVGAVAAAAEALARREVTRG